MSKQEYLAFHQACITKLSQITEQKNSDYTGSSENPFENFCKVEANGLCSVEVGFMTRMYDKMSRIQTFVLKGELKVLDEKVEDTLLDLANYCILLAGYIKSKEKETNANRESRT